MFGLALTRVARVTFTCCGGKQCSFANSIQLRIVFGKRSSTVLSVFTVRLVVKVGAAESS